MIEIIHWSLIALAVPIIAFLVVTTVRRARALSDRIDEYHKEEEEAKQSGQSINPYEAMSRIVDVRPRLEDRKEDK